MLVERLADNVVESDGAYEWVGATKMEHSTIVSSSHVKLLAWLYLWCRIVMFYFGSLAVKHEGQALTGPHTDVLCWRKKPEVVYREEYRRWIGYCRLSVARIRSTPQ